MSEERTQLKDLAKRVPDQFIGKNHNNMQAMEHTVATQLLLAKLGSYDFEMVEILRGPTKKDKDAHIVTGVVCRLRAVIDGKTVTIEEAGGLENAGNPDGDGERLKHAMSDALKRCAMRMGLGLHIWADNHYFLDKLLDKDDSGVPGEAAVEPKTQDKKQGASESKPMLSTPKREAITNLILDVKYDGGVPGFEEKGLKGKKIAQLTDKQADKVIDTLTKRKEELEASEPEDFDPEEVEGVQKGVPVG